MSVEVRTRSELLFDDRAWDQSWDDDLGRSSMGSPVKLSTDREIKIPV
jgi:hypothetical protein